jgi:hypothetical protein
MYHHTQLYCDYLQSNAGLQILDISRPREESEQGTWVPGVGTNKHTHPLLCGRVPTGPGLGYGHSALELEALEELGGEAGCSHLLGHEVFRPFLVGGVK